MEGPAVDLNPDPFAAFGEWFRHARESELPEPTAMTVATVAPSGRPSARVVLLKSFDERGFVFVTNYESRKAREADATGHAAIVFHWTELGRQVRIEGRLSRCSEEESDALFAARPRDSQLGAWASPQSREIPDRRSLMVRFDKIRRRYPDEVPRPLHWGGYRLAVDRFEFWIGRPHRLHDRLIYVPDDEGAWRRSRLAP